MIMIIITTTTITTATTITTTTTTTTTKHRSSWDRRRWSCCRVLQLLSYWLYFSLSFVEFVADLWYFFLLNGLFQKKSRTLQWNIEIQHSRDSYACRLQLSTLSDGEKVMIWNYNCSIFISYLFIYLFEPKMGSRMTTNSNCSQSVCRWRMVQKILATT